MCRVTALVVVVALAATAALACSATSPATRHATAGVSYYLSLGDSLSVGVQPDAAGKSLPTGQGYASQLYAALRVGDPGLHLVKLGCSGESTHTMIDGGICSYPAHSQLADAVSFLHTHNGRVSLITIDIGANDPDSCITRTSLGAIVSCVAKGFPQTVANLTKIMSSLRAAAGSKVRIIGMNYYVPALSQWLDGPLGQQYARWTWECAASPRGPNEHARPVGPPGQDRPGRADGQDRVLGADRPLRTAAIVHDRHSRTSVQPDSSSARASQRSSRPVFSCWTSRSCAPSSISLV